MVYIPLHIKILMYLGVVNVKCTKESDEESILNRNKSHAPKLRIRLPSGNNLLLIAGIVPMIIGVVMVITPDAVVSSPVLPEIPRTDIGKEVYEASIARDKYAWKAEGNQERLLEIKNKIDKTTSCGDLLDMFKQNPGWSMRTYLAHTIIEQQCI